MNGIMGEVTLFVFNVTLDPLYCQSYVEKLITKVDRYPIICLICFGIIF